MTKEIEWSYTAEDPTGLTVKGSKFANSKKAAVLNLYKDGLAPLEVEKRYAPLARAIVMDDSTSLKKKLGEFCDGMSDLLGSGITIESAFLLLREQSRLQSIHPFLDRCLDRLRAGATLADSLRVDPSTPPRILVALTEVGETLGTLDSQYRLLAQYFIERQKLRKIIVGNLLYPACLTALLLVTVLFLSYFVLPEFEVIFEASTITPPVETRIVLAFGAIIREYWFIFPTIAIVVPIIGKLFSPYISKLIEQLLFNIPFTERIIRILETSVYCRTLSALLAGGAQISEAMPLARSALNSRTLSYQAKLAEVDINSGALFSASMAKHEVISPEAISFASIGEKTGNLAFMIEKAAFQSESVMKTLIERSTSLLNPILTAFMGLITACVIASVMTGILSLNEVVN